MKYFTLWLLLCSCAPASLSTFVKKEQLQFDHRPYADDAAVVLHRADRTRLFVDGSDAFTLSSRHEVVAVLGEGGLELAEVRIPFNASWKLRSFSARIVRPDGTTQTLGDDALLSDNSGRGRRDGNARFFRFPNASVGCVLEYIWTIEAPGIWPSDEQDTLGEFPVRHYEFELTAPKEIVLETIELNGGAPINIQKGEELNTLSFQLDDLPARHDVDAAPHWTFTEPRWAWRIVSLNYGKERNDWLRDWKDVVNGHGNEYFLKGLDDDFDVPFDTKDCRDTQCIVQRAVDTVRAHTERGETQWNRSAKLVDAWHSGQASNVEQALMVKALLERASLKVWLGFGTGLLNRQTMQFPNTSQFDRLFVVLRPQNGVSTTMFVDASCESCRAGELSPEYAGLPIFVFRTGRRVDVLVSDGVWEQPNVKMPPSTLALSHVTKLEPDGALDDELKITARGTTTEPVVEQWRRSKHRLFDNERRLTEASSPLANLRSAKWSPCDATSCGWTTHVRYENEVSRDGARWLMPTSFLRAAYEETFLPEARDVDVHFKEPLHFEEVADVIAPPGLQLVSVPAPVKVGRDGFQVEVKWERTAEGARVTRKLTQEIVSIPSGRYGEVRNTIEAFRRARREVLVFAPQKAEVSSAP